MSIELVCDNCGQRKVVKSGDAHYPDDWTWVNVVASSSILIATEVRCPDCKEAVVKAREQAERDALASRAKTPLTPR